MDETPKKKSLSEISHLFLSSVRDNATGGIRPKRVPPGSDRGTKPAAPKPDVSIDLTPAEFAKVYGGTEFSAAANSEQPAVGPVSAVICSQFNGHQLDRVKQYARHLAAGGERVGLIEVDSAECRMMCFERNGGEAIEPFEPTHADEPREMAEALEELACDIDRWILLLPTPRTAEARGLLRQVNHWVLLSTCDHDGVVSCYRAIKGLVDTHRPRLTLALLNAIDQTEAAKVYRKIAGVCEQFLNWKMDAEAAVEPADGIAEHLTLVYRPTRERTAIGPAAHWQIVGDFIARSTNQVAETKIESPSLVQAMKIESDVMPAETKHVTDFVIPIAAQRGPVVVATETATAESRVTAPNVEIAAPVLAPVAMTTIEDDSDIAELPTGEITESAVLTAIMRKPGSGLAECPVRAPACPEATLAVGRDRRLVLLAVARKGLTELRAINQAYRWVIENRPLLSMALPQFAIDTHAMPSLRLIVDRADAHADLLLPMTQNGNVTVQTYRKLRWAGKTGLLLEAA